MHPIRIRLIHWSAPEAQEKAAWLKAAGYLVEYEPYTPAIFRQVKADPPAAFVIDLSRLPSQGRDIAVQLRQPRSIRQIPLIFVSGEAEKTARVRELLPDAIFTSWEGIAEALETALEAPSVSPITPKSNFAAYAGAPFVQKLGIKENSAILLIQAPAGFTGLLGELPQGAQLHEDESAPFNLIIWFVRSRHELDTGLERVKELAAKNGLWIAWPKKTSTSSSDLSQVVVRQATMAAGLVDYKISAFDETWSGLRFSLKKE